MEAFSFDDLLKLERAEADARPNKNTIIVTVRDGIADVNTATIPAGHMVEVRDYDITETASDPDSATKDLEGEEYNAELYNRQAGLEEEPKAETRPTEWEAQAEAIVRLDYTKFDGHTPGPWTFDSRGNGFILGADHGAWDSTIATMCDYATRDVRQQRQTPNARLIVAAPTLLARCKALEEALESIFATHRNGVATLGGHIECVDIARRALRGEA